MAEGKKIEVTMVAAGGDQAAAEIRKPEEAIQDLGEKSAAAAEDASKLNERVSQIARIQQAAAISAVANAVGTVGQNLQASSKDVEAFDADLADTMQRAGQGLEQLGGSVNLVASAFATGGPVAAALAASAVAIKSVFDAWTAGEKQAAQSAAAQKAALHEVEEATRKGTTAALARNTAFSTAEVLASLDAQLKKHQDISEEMHRQIGLARDKRQIESEVLDSNDQAQLAGEDLEEAQGSITPLAAAEKRAEIEAAARKRRREERKRIALEDSAAAANDALQKTRAAATTRETADELARRTADAETTAGDVEANARRAMGSVRPQKNGELSDNDKRFIEAMEQEVIRAKDALKILTDAEAKAKAAAVAAEAAAAAARQFAGDQNTRAQDTVSGLDAVDAADARREQTSGQARARREFNEAKKRADEKAADQARREADARGDLETEASGIGVQAGRAAGNLGAQSGFTQRLERLGAAISRKGDSKGDESNLRQMMAMIETMMGLIEKRGPDAMNDKDAQKLREMDKKLKTLEARISRARDGR
jgi:hypothetical protein